MAGGVGEVRSCRQLVRANAGALPDDRSSPVRRSGPRQEQRRHMPPTQAMSERRRGTASGRAGWLQGGTTGATANSNRMKRSGRFCRYCPTAYRGRCKWPVVPRAKYKFWFTGCPVLSKRIASSRPGIMMGSTLKSIMSRNANGMDPPVDAEVDRHVR